MNTLVGATTRSARPTIRSRTFVSHGTQSFSSSQIRSAYLPPAFEPTVSPELDTLLESIRRKVLLPRHIHGDNKKLVGDPERNKILSQEDVRLKIGEHEERLEPHVFGKDGLSFHNSFREARTLSETTGDFSFWPRLLQGFHSAALNSKPIDRDILIRKACKSGQVALVMGWMSQAKHNGFYPTADSVFRVPHAIRHQALFADTLLNVEESLSTMAPEVVQRIKETIETGQSTDELAREVPGLGAAIAKSLQQGLKRAIQLNFIFTKPEITKALSRPTGLRAEQSKRSGDENYYEGKLSLNDPILAAVPLEMQSKLQAILAIDPSAITAKENSDEPLPPPTQTTAAGYAVRLLHSLKEEPIDITTLPPQIPSSATSREQRPRKNDQVNWLFRTIAVASSLRAASAVIKNDAALFQEVTLANRHVEKAMYDALPTIVEGMVPATYVSSTEDLVKRYREGREYGRFGDESVFRR